MYALSEIAIMMQARLIGKGADRKEWQLSIDSRTVANPDQTIFFALITAGNDGHKYIKQLAASGVSVFVVQNLPDEVFGDHISFLKVDDTFSALQRLSTAHRLRFTIPVIGITGSNGKTIVKEWLLQLLHHRFAICASPRSFNSQIGVPLSIWPLHEDHQIGIFEAGISMPGEMERLENIIRPTIGMLTHMGTAHDEGFESSEQKLNEKLKLFNNAEVVLMRYDETVIDKVGRGKAITVGYNNEKAALNITQTKSTGRQTTMQGVYKGQTYTITVPFSDDASIENISLAWLCSLYVGAFKSSLFEKLQPVSMRLELKQAVNNCLLINDSYSNDLHGLGVALSFLKRQTIHMRSAVILSDIEQSGLSDEEWCRQVAKLLTSNKVDAFYGIGPVLKQWQHVFNEIEKGVFFDSTEAFIKEMDTIRFNDESILLKGARHYAFEKIAARLVRQTHGTVLEIDLTAAAANLTYIRNKVGRETKVMAMVKAFAYGSGSYEMAKMLDGKVDYMAVAYTDEGVTLRQNGIRTPIMIMNADEETFGHLFRYNLEPAVFSISQLQALQTFAEGRPLNVHVEIDTGMHRLGFSPGQADDIAEWFIRNENIRIKSLFSHLSASDEAVYDEFTKQQSKIFGTVAEKLSETIPYTFDKHISNTAAALRFQELRYDMVRLGIGLYGIDPSGEHQKNLKHVFTLKTVVSQVKWIEANESIGYSRKAIENRKRKIAVLAIGYADGLNRHLSNGAGGFIIRGQYAKVAGNVCMDMCMVDVTDIPCEAGDEAELFGGQYDILQLAASLNTIPYEILTGISQRIRRVYISE